ncbi:MAG: outer membrane beta-barrel protein, partial [Acidobacteria bacterium]|nr:outer membrane beta-barrel protein [Acidobacteriota bacterium]
MRRMRWIGLVLALLALTLTASAQVKDKRVELSPYIGGIFYDGDLNLKDNLLFGFRVGYNFNPRFGLEGGADFSFPGVDDTNLYPLEEVTFGIPAMSTNNMFYHVDGLIYLFPESRFNPFFVVGLGGARYAPDRGDTLNKFLTNFGFGAKYWMSDRVALRFDFRDLVSLDEARHNLAAQAGLAIAIGEKPMPPPPPPPPPAPVVEQPKPEP